VCGHPLPAEAVRNNDHGPLRPGAIVDCPLSYDLAVLPPADSMPAVAVLPVDIWGTKTHRPPDRSQNGHGLENWSAI